MMLISFIINTESIISQAEDRSRHLTPSNSQICSAVIHRIRVQRGYQYPCWNNSVAQPSSSKLRGVKANQSGPKDGLSRLLMEWRKGRRSERHPIEDFHRYRDFRVLCKGSYWNMYERFDLLCAAWLRGECWFNNEGLFLLVNSAVMVLMEDDQKLWIEWPIFNDATQYCIAAINGGIRFRNPKCP